MDKNAMKKNGMNIFCLLCFSSVFFSCQAVASVNKGPFVPLVSIPKGQAISYLGGSPPFPILGRPFLQTKKRFFVGGGFYEGPNFPCRYYQTWYNNHYSVPYNFNKETYFDRRPINIPYNLDNKNQYLFNGKSSLIKYPFAGNGNEISLDNNGNFFHVNNLNDQYEQVKPLNQQFPFNRDNYFSENPYNEKEEVVFYETNIIHPDGSLDKGHAEGAIVVIKEPNTVIEGLSNSALEKEDLAVVEANVIGKSIISQNIVAHAAKGGSAYDGYIIKYDGAIDSKLNNGEGEFILDGTGLEISVLSEEGGTNYGINSNLTLHSILGGKVIENNQEISQQTNDGDLNQKLNFEENKGTRYYIVKGPTQDDLKAYYGNRSLFAPFYGGNSAYGGAGSYIGGRVGQPLGFNSGGFNNLEAIGGGAAFSSGAAIGVEGGIQNGAGVDESASVSIGAGGGINRGISSSEGVSVSGQVGISRGNGGSYSSIGGEASVNSGVGVGTGGGFSRGVGIEGVPSFGGGVGLGGVAGISGVNINSAASFNAGSYQVPSQINYIYRKAL